MCLYLLGGLSSLLLLLGLQTHRSPPQLTLGYEEVLEGQRRSIAMEMEGMVRPPTTRRALIVTTWRSGSTFTGELLHSHPATFYHYEPLQDLDTVQAQVRRGTEVDQERAVTRLKKLLSCDYSGLERHLKYKCERKGGLYKIYNEFCFEPDFMSRFCSLFPFQSMKTVRLPLSLTEELLMDESLSLRLVLLVRDPRAVMASLYKAELRACAFHTDCRDPQRLCRDMEDDHAAALKLSQAFPGKLRVVRYEDLALNVTEGSKDLLSFFGLSFTPSVEKFIRSHTSLSSRNAFDTYRNSTEAALHWRSDLNFAQVEAIQASCGRVMSLYGYRTARDAEHLLSLSPVGPFEPPK